LAAISAYLQAKNERESAVFDERHSGGASGSGREANVVRDNDISVAVLDMIGAVKRAVQWVGALRFYHRGGASRKGAA